MEQQRSEPRAQRRLTVPVVDVVGYSRLMGRDKERAHAELKSVRKTLVDPTIVAHRRHIAKTTCGHASRVRKRGEVIG